MADAAGAREQAREILGGRKYRDASVPQPFKRPLSWVGDRIHDAGRWLAHRFDDVNGSVPGGAWVLWIVLGLLVTALAIVLSRSAIRRRALVLAAREDDVGEPQLDPSALEREAADAERAGDYERAVRLRFRAGVLRLERGEVLAPGGLRTTGSIGAVLGSPRFDALGVDFDEIAYGGRAALEQDAEASKAGWREVVSSSSGRGGGS